MKMPMPPNSQLTESLLVRYLLAQLPEQEMARIDALSISDEQVADQLRNVENDLVDSYARGELAGEDLRCFEEHYFATPARRQKVRFASGLQAATLHSPLVASGRDSKLQERRRPFFKNLFLGSPIPALALVLLIFGGLFLVNNLRHRDRGTIQQADDDRDRHPVATSANDQSPNVGTSVPPKPAEHETPGMVSYLLPPPMRASGSPPRLVVHKSTQTLVLRLPLEANDFRSYRFGLNTSAGNLEAWKSGALRPRNNILTVEIPAEKLNGQLYLADLYGIPASGNPELVSTYSFEIVIE